jgi:hypothetical protein
MSDLVASWLRTVVPGLYSAVIGSALAWLAAHAAWALDLLELLNIDPTSAGFVAGVVAVVLAAWYAIWRRLEPHIPDWLTRLVLGSVKRPVYIGPGEVAAVAPKNAYIAVEGEIVRPDQPRS